MLIEKDREMTSVQNEKEIDLLHLFDSFVLKLVKRRKYIVGAFVGGIIIGLAFYFTTQPTYTSQMTGYSESLKIEVVNGVIEDLHKTLADRNYVLAQKFLGLSQEKIRSIKKITCRSAVEKSIYEKDESGIFIIEATVSDVSVLDSLSFALEHYFQENYFVKRRTSLERSKMKQLIQNIEIETKSLYELQGNMNEAIAKNTYRTNLFLSDIGYASAKIVELLDKKAELENKLQQLEELKVLKNFVKFTKKTNPRISTSIILGETICFLIIILIWVTRSVFKYASLLDKNSERR